MAIYNVKKLQQNVAVGYVVLKEEEIIPRLCEHGDGWTCFRRLGLNYAPFDTECRLGASELHWVHTHRYNGTSVNHIAEPVAATLKRRTTCSHGQERLTHSTTRVI